MITLAFYKGRGSSWWIRLQDGLIRFATRSPYSHVELIVGRAEHDREETCLSSSGRDGGVREKRIVLERAKWAAMTPAMASAAGLSRPPAR